MPLCEQGDHGALRQREGGDVTYGVLVSPPVRTERQTLMFGGIGGLVSRSLSTSTARFVTQM
jgi:hypothetical protein